MNATTPALEIVHRPGRFQATVEGRTCVADYHLAGDVMDMVHTEVPPALRGRGIAAALVEAALRHARTQGLRVEPSCSYVAAYMRRHRDTHDLYATR